MRWAVLALAVACSTSRHTEQRLDEVAKVDAATHAQATETRTVQTGPETITTTTRVYALPTATPEGVMSSEPEPEPERLRHSDSTEHGVAVGRGAAGEPAHGPLLSETTTVDVRSPIVQQTTLNAQAATETHTEGRVDAEAASTSKAAPSAGCGVGLSLWALVALGVLAAAAWLYLKR